MAMRYFQEANNGADRLTWLGCSASLVCVPSFAAAGWAMDERWGFAAFGLLAAAVLIDLAVGISVFASAECRRGASGSGVMPLATAGVIHGAVAIEDAAAVFTPVAILLTFPCGLAGPPI